MFVGHSKQLQSLEAAKDNGRLGHAYIFSGPSKAGKKTAALEWLSRILGTSLAEGAAHPDFLFVKPLIDSKTGKTAGEITVNQIRGLINKLSFKPALGPYKAAVVDNAELMNGEAQNCLLKTLEEPPGNAIIVLVTQNSQRLLETIRSRCQTVQFNFVPEKEMEIMAKDLILKSGDKIDETLAGEIVELSFGRPGRLAEFIANPEQLKKWRANAKEFAKIINAELPEKFAYAKKITDIENEDANLDEIMEIWQFHFRKLMLETLNKTENGDVAWVGPTQKNPLRGSDPREETTAKAAGARLLRDSQESCSCQASAPFVFGKTKENPYTLEKIAAILKKIHDLNVTLTATNANPKLAIENFMLDI